MTCNCRCMILRIGDVQSVADALRTIGGSSITTSVFEASVVRVEIRLLTAKVKHFLERSWPPPPPR